MQLWYSPSDYKIWEVWFSYWSNVIHLDVIDTYVQQNFWVFFMVDSTFFLICPVPYFHTVNSYSPSIYIIMHFFIIIHPESVCNFNLQLNSTWINMSISLQFKPNIFLSFFFLFFFSCWWGYSCGVNPIGLAPWGACTTHTCGPIQA